jgi:heat shock protein HslJ
VLVRSAKKLAAAACAAACVLLLTSCAAPVDEGGPDPGLRGQWELQSATDTAGSIPLANQLISLTIDGDTTTAGRSTCSNYRARVYGNVTSLWVTASLPRAENCGIQAQQDIEHRYIDDLNQVRTSSLSGGVLDLMAPGIDLRFVRALAVPTTLVVERTWHLTTVRPDSYYGNSNSAYYSIGGATLRLGADGTMTGTTGCHSFTANYSQNAGEIVADHLVEHPSGDCESMSPTADAVLLQVVRAGFTFFSESGALSISSPRAQLTLDFVD